MLEVQVNQFTAPRIEFIQARQLAAQDLGIPTQTLNTWVRHSKRTDRPAFTGRGVPALTEQEKRIKDLERENAVLRQEREIVLTLHQHLRAWVA